MSPRLHTVDLLSASGALTVQWRDAPGEHERTAESTMLSQIERQRAALETAEHRGTPVELAKAQRDLGITLFFLLDGPERALQHRLDADRSAGQPLHLILRLRSSEPKELARHPALGWHLQLLTHPSSESPLALQPQVILNVQLGDAEASSSALLPTGRLQLLFMAYSPRDVQPPLDYEAEEERILDQLAPFVEQRRLVVRVAEEGTLSELRRRLMLRSYDIVHLSGHGTVTDEGPRLLMENELGAQEQISPEQLLQVLHAGRVMPRLVVLASCHTAEQRSDLPSLAAQLLLGGVPCVVGWTRPVEDETATLATAQLYQSLCRGEVPAQAVAHARQLLHEKDFQRGQPTHAWATLQLLTTTPERPPADEETPDSASTYRMLGKRMRVLERGFVGRRRELQALGRVLRRGAWAAQGEAEHPVAGATVIGMKGQGKSCLVGRAVDRLLQDTGELSLVVLHGVLDEFSVVEAFREEAVRLGDSAVQALLTDGSLLPLKRLEIILREHWRERRMAIILDDFEQNLDIPGEGEAQLNPLASSLLKVLVPACLDGQSRLLITSTARFSPPTSIQNTLVELELGALDGASVRKLWHRGPNGKPLAHLITSKDWTRLSERLGRNARILDWARQLLSGKTSAELRDIATRAGQQLPVWSTTAPDKAKQDELVALFLRHIAFQEAHAKVGPDALTFIQRARVYDEPVPAEAFTGLTEGLSISLERHLVALANLGLLEVGREKDTRVYRVSPLVKEVFDAPDAEHWHAVAAAYWWKAAPRSGGLHTSSVIQAWRHALRARQQPLADKIADLIGPWLDGQGHFPESVNLSEQHRAAFPHSVVGLLWAGYARFRAGQPREGLPLLQRGIEHARLLSEEHQRLPHARELLARLLMSLGEHFQARQQLQELVAAEQQAHPEGSQTLAGALHTLAGVLWVQGDLPAARSLLERSLEIDKKVFGTEEHPNVAAVLHTLAGVLRDLGDLPAARSHLERALTIEKKVRGTEQHHAIAVSLSVLAGVLKAQGDLSAARSALERALLINKGVLGTEQHPEIADALHELGSLLATQGDLPQARIHLERALYIKQKVLGTEEHHDVAASLRALASVHRALADLPTARSLLERALSILKKVHGTEERLDVAASFHELARVNQDQKDLPAARSLIERSLHIQKKLLGTEEHHDVAASLHQLANVLKAQGDLPAARSLLERVLDIEKKLLGTEEHHSIAVSYVGLADCLQELRLFEESEAAFRKALALYERVHHTREHYMIAEAEVGLGSLLWSQGRQGEAHPLLQHAISVLRAQVPHHPLLRQLLGYISGPAVDPNELASFALTVRELGEPLPEELLAQLHALRSAGPPHNLVADILEQLARGGPLPPVPPGLSDDAAAFVASVLEAAEDTSFQP